MQHLKEIILPNYPLILSLLKYRNVWVFWNKKKSGSDRCSPLNSSIEIINFFDFFFLLPALSIPINNYHIDRDN